MGHRFLFRARRSVIVRNADDPSGRELIDRYEQCRIGQLDRPPRRLRTGEQLPAELSDRVPIENTVRRGTAFDRVTYVLRDALLRRGTAGKEKDKAKRKDVFDSRGHWVPSGADCPPSRQFVNDIEWTPWSDCCIVACPSDDVSTATGIHVPVIAELAPWPR